MLLTKLDQGISHAINLASYAPSSHNSQPWELVLVKSNIAQENIQNFLAQNNPNDIEDCKPDYYLILSLNQDRCLTSLPAHELEMVLSCGAFLESLVIALASQQLKVVYCWYNNHIKSNPIAQHISLPSSWIPLSIISIYRNQVAISGDASQEKVSLFKKRITNRGPYQTTQISIDTIEQLAKSQSLAFPEIHKNCQITLLQKPEEIKKIGFFFKTHSQVEVTEPLVWKETYKWMHFSNKAIQQAETGLPITQLLGPVSPLWKQIYKFLLTPPSIRLLNSIGFADYIALQYWKSVESAPLLGYFNFNSNHPSLKTQLGGGALWLNFCLNATTVGLAVQPLSVVLQHSDIRLEFQQKFNLPDGRGFFFCRVGYPVVSFPPAPKRRNLWQEVYTI